MSAGHEPSGHGNASATWTLRGAQVEYTVTVPADRQPPATRAAPADREPPAAPAGRQLPAPGRWAELVAWGPTGVSDGPSPVSYHGPTPFRTAGDAGALEYATDADRPFAGADLVVETATGQHGVRWDRYRADGDDRRLRIEFTDSVTGLHATLHYQIPAGTDVLRRWVELTNAGTEPLHLLRAGSAGFCVPTPHRALLNYQWGQWAQEFQLGQVELDHGEYRVGSTQGVPGHSYLPWLAVRDAATPDGPTWGVAFAWTGSWEMTAERDTGGLTRIRVGRQLVDGPLTLPPGERITLPVACGAYSPDGLAGLARVWHEYQRVLAGDRLSARPVLYNSWEATEFAVHADEQLQLARIAAQLGVETFVVDDGWFLGRYDDRRGLGDWAPDPAKFPDGFEQFIAAVRRLGLTFGLWVEPECVSPRSQLYAEHPDWVYAIDGRPLTQIRNQYLLDLGRAEVAEFVHSTLDGLLRRYEIGYLKWDFNRPRTEPGRPGAAGGGLDLDGAHVANLYRIYEQLRRDHPHVLFEACAGGGARTDLAMAARADVLWPSDNTGPLDRLAIQYGFLHANAPHLLSSWVTDSPGLFDQRPRSLAFRFVLAMAGVLGIGADIRGWGAQQRSEAAAWIARYKQIRDVVTHGTVHLIGAPDQPRCAIQYTAPDATSIVVLAWNTGRLDGAGLLPARPVRLPLRGLDPSQRYRDERGETYSGAHLATVGLPVCWTATHDAELMVLRPSPTPRTAKETT